MRRKGIFFSIASERYYCKESSSPSLRSKQPKDWSERKMKLINNFVFSLEKERAKEMVGQKEVVRQKKREKRWERERERDSPEPQFNLIFEWSEKLSSRHFQAQNFMWVKPLWTILFKSNWNNSLWPKTWEIVINTWKIFLTKMTVFQAF